MKRILYPLFVLLLFTQSVFAIEDEELFRPVEIKNGSVLTIIDCISSAYKNSPKIRRQKYNLDIAKSNVGIAKSQYFPVISAGVGFYNENNSDNIYYDSHYRELPTVGIAINKLIWDFGKTTANIKMEEFYKIGAEYEFMDSLCATLFDIKAKYYNLLKYKALLDIEKRNILMNEKFVKIAIDESALTTAKVSLTKAQLSLIDMENKYKNAKADLDNSMYIDSQINYDIKNTSTFNLNKNFTDNISHTEFQPEKFDFTKDKAVEIAYESSPDLQVLISTKKAMEQSLKYIKRTYFPELTAGAGYGFNNSTNTSNNSLTVGVNLSSAVNLMELKHSIKGADAQVNLADNEIILFKKDLYYELQRAFNNIEKTEKRIPIAQKSAIETYETLKIVETSYSKGELDYTTYKDAINDYYEALVRYVNSLYEYNMALIQVEMAMHYHIVDIHHKSEHAMHYHSDDLIKHLIEALDCDKEHQHKTDKKSKREKL